MTTQIFFEGIPASELKARFRVLSMKYHPDRGGDTKTFQAMKKEYEDRVAGRWSKPRQQSYSSQSGPGSSKNASTKESKSAFNDFDDYFSNADGRWSTRGSKYQDPFREYEQYREKKQRAQPKTINQKVTPEMFMRSKAFTVKVDGKTWEIRIDPKDKKEKTLVDAKTEQPLYRMNVSYEIDDLIIFAKETKFSRVDGFVTAKVMTPEDTEIGFVDISMTDIKRGATRTRIDEIRSNTGFDLNDWKIAKHRFLLEKFKEPTDFFGKCSLWFERKLYKINRKYGV